jgi:AcrR family transcriptional regulator
MRSAASVFRRRGYHGSSVEEIAGVLNMTKGNLYYYFKNKEEILFMCHDYALDVIQEQVTDVEKSALPVEQKVHAIISSFVHLFIDVLHGTAWTLELEALSPPLLKKIVAKRDRVDRGIRRLLREGMDTGVFAPGDPKLLTFAIMGAINWIPLWFKTTGSAQAEDVAQVFADYLVGGLLAPKASVSRADRAPGIPRVIALTSGVRKIRRGDSA